MDASPEEGGRVTDVTKVRPLMWLRYHLGFLVACCGMGFVWIADVAVTLALELADLSERIAPEWERILHENPKE